jgi:uncharacterized protein YndB with AHSA1/START domain
MTDTIPSGERGYTLTRTFDAPRAVVWRALTEPDLFAQWFGTRTADVEIHQWDLEPGGQWRATMRFPGGEMPWAGRFLEIDAPSRLVLAVVDAVEIGETFELLTMTLAEQGAGTEFVLRQSGHMSEEEYQQAKEGSAGFLDALAEVVGELR